MATSRKKPKSSVTGYQSNKSVRGISSVSIPASSVGTVFNNNSLYPATPGYTTGFVQQYSDNSPKHNDENYYSIELSRSNQGVSYPMPMMFYSEEEFVFSFITLYNDMQSGKKYSTTSNGIFDIQNLIHVRLIQNINGAKILLSPFYVLKRAKELKYEKA